MAVYGPVRHPKNIIWTEASEANRENKNDKFYHILLYRVHLARNRIFDVYLSYGHILYFTFLFSLFASEEIK
jgi:hypothetical protein